MKVRALGDIILIEPHGELTTDNGGRELRAKVEELIQLGQHKILVNLHDVTYVDTGGIEALLAIHSAASNGEGRVRFCDPNSEIQYLLSMTRLSNSKSVYSNEQEAVASFTWRSSMNR
jgi:anti-anti-sigma factor